MRQFYNTNVATDQIRIMKLLRNLFLVTLFIFASTMAVPIKVINRIENKEDTLKVLENTPLVYCSTKDFARLLSTNIYENKERAKIVIYIYEHRVKISAGTSFIVIDGVVYQMKMPAIFYGEDIYLPAESFIKILHNTVFPGITFNRDANEIVIVQTDFNIKNIRFEEKANGTILRIGAQTHFEQKEMSTFLHKNGWFYVTIQGGTADQKKIINVQPRGIIKKVGMDQFKDGIQLSFLLKSDIAKHELYQNKTTNEIVITLWEPVSKSVAKIQEMKDQWNLDTVVLDAGHGGKDPGTIGRKGTKEKNITLDIVQRLGKLITRNTTVKVIYTRNEDVFIPLWKRTKIANDNNGKIFISVHANANRSSRSNGFETYLLRPGKTQDAIEVATQENAAIKYEELRDGKYHDLTPEGMILATMAQSTFMKESESLAEQIQTELSKNISAVNRGVKQAGFYVLIGASMPNVLIEVGFLSNANEEKRLRTPTYRQKIAESIYRAIIKFKKEREFVMAEGG